MWDYVLVALFGALTALVEVSSRYQDKGFGSLRNIYGLLYVLVNASISCFGLYVVYLYVYPELLDTTAAVNEQARFQAILLAGFSAQAVFRSSFLTIKVKGNDVNIGLAQVITMLLEVLDREVDRRQAGSREDLITVSTTVAYDDMKNVVFPIAISMMSNVAIEDEQRLRSKINDLDSNTDIPDTVKSTQLAAYLSNVVGSTLLINLLEVTRGLFAQNAPADTNYLQEIYESAELMSPENPATSDPP